MIFSLATYTLVHVVLSLVGIGAGLVLVAGMLSGKRLNGWTALFLATTLATSVTGFGFPFVQFLPSHGVGIISVVVLLLAIFAVYARHLRGGWRRVFVITAVAALYFNVFVGVVQAFLKVPALNAMAPTQSEPPFAVAQLTVLVLFVVLGFAATTRFRTA